jgi:hypothetical protein
MLNPQMNSRGAVKHRPHPASVAEPTISPDSLLEQRGIELGTGGSNPVCSTSESAENLLDQGADDPVAIDAKLGKGGDWRSSAEKPVSGRVR